MPEGVRKPVHVESGSAEAVPLLDDRSEIGCARQAPRPRETLGRQRAPCLEGVRTDRRLRPFLRRRFRTARPHRVLIRARNPCFRTRLRLRG